MREVETLRKLVEAAPEHCLIRSVDSAEENIKTAFQVAAVSSYLPSEIGDDFYAVTSFASDLVFVLSSIGADILAENGVVESVIGPATQEDIRKMSSIESLKLFWVTAALIDADRIFKDVLEGYAAVLRKTYDISEAAA